jgi:RNA polymerase primary sigma factor
MARKVPKRGTKPDGKTPPEPVAVPVPAAAQPTEPADPMGSGTPWDELPMADRSPLRFYLDEIGKTPLLTPEEEVALARRIQKGDSAARQHMIQANLRLVVRIARDYEDFGLPLMDLISEGNLGLIKAVERFDPDKGGKLSTYAAWWIKQSMKRALASNGRSFRLPVHMVDRIAAMRRIIHQLTIELEREPTNDELSQVMELPVNKIAHLKTLANRSTSLDTPIGEDGDATLGDLVKDEAAVSPYESLRGKSDRSDIDDLLSGLEPREAEIIRLRFGLNGEAPLTLEQVGVKFKLTRERVRQLEHLALMHLRRSMADKERIRTPDEAADERKVAARNEVLREFFRAQRQREARDDAKRKGL